MFNFSFMFTVWVRICSIDVWQFFAVVQQKTCCESFQSVKQKPGVNSQHHRVFSEQSPSPIIYWFGSEHLQIPLLLNSFDLSVGHVTAASTQTLPHDSAAYLRTPPSSRIPRWAFSGLYLLFFSFYLKWVLNMFTPRYVTCIQEHNKESWTQKHFFFCVFSW